MLLVVPVFGARSALERGARSGMPPHSKASLQPFPFRADLSRSDFSKPTYLHPATRSTVSFDSRGRYAATFRHSHLAPKTDGSLRLCGLHSGLICPWGSSFPTFSSTPAKVIRGRLEAFIRDAGERQIRAWAEEIPPLQGASRCPLRARSVLEGQGPAPVWSPE